MTHLTSRASLSLGGSAALVLLTLTLAVFVIGYSSSEVRDPWPMLRHLGAGHPVEGSAAQGAPALDRAGWVAAALPSSYLVEDLFAGLLGPGPLWRLRCFGFWLIGLFLTLDAVRLLSRQLSSDVLLFPLALCIALLLPPISASGIFPDSVEAATLGFPILLYVLALLSRGHRAVALGLLLFEIYCGWGIFLAAAATSFPFFLKTFGSSSEAPDSARRRGAAIGIASIALMTTVLALAFSQSDSLIGRLFSPEESPSSLELLALSYLSAAVLLVRTELRGAEARIRESFFAALAVCLPLAVARTIAPLPDVLAQALGLGLRAIPVFAALTFAALVLRTGRIVSGSTALLCCAALMLGAFAGGGVYFITGVAALLLGVTFGRSWLSRRSGASILLLTAALLVLLSGFRDRQIFPHRRPINFAGMPDSLVWIRDNTAQFSLFLIPPDLWLFEWRTERSGIGGIPLSGNFDPGAASVQIRNVSEIIAEPIPHDPEAVTPRLRSNLSAIYRLLSPVQVAQAMRNFGADYFVTYTTPPGESRFDNARFEAEHFKIVYQDDWLSILTLDSF